VLQIAIGQLMTQPMAQCHVPQKTNYKQGLWLVQGKLLQPQERSDAHTVVALAPTESELSRSISTMVCSSQHCALLPQGLQAFDSNLVYSALPMLVHLMCNFARSRLTLVVTKIVSLLNTAAGLQLRETASIVDSLERPLLQPEFQQLTHPAAPAGASYQPPLARTQFSQLLAPAEQTADLQLKALKRVCSQYREVLTMDSVQVFDNVGELYIFMETFSAQQYLSAQPQSADVMTDMTVMRTWKRDLTSMAPLVHNELMCFDLEDLRSKVLATATAAIQAFAKLVRETMFDKCTSIQACSASA
jgi:hypothetical protein